MVFDGCNRTPSGRMGLALKWCGLEDVTTTWIVDVDLR